MRALAWALVPVCLVVGVAIGYGVRGTQTKTTTTTVVQIQTVAPPPPATHKLTAVVEGADGGCLASDQTHYNEATSDMFVLRRPGNGLTNGEVVGVSSGTAMDRTDCDLNLVFLISPKLGFFVVSDDNQGVTWGPFDSSQMASRGWLVQLKDNG